MKLSNANTLTLLLSMLLVSLMILPGCEDNSFATRTPPDFSTVPDPYDTTQAVSVDRRDNGLVIYTIAESQSPLPEVVYRDAVMAYYTGRKKNGETFASTYANGNTNPSRFSNLTPINQGQVSSLIEGFRLGLIGMKEGEKRTVVIPPSLGYGDQSGSELQNDTLVYDLLLDEILD